MFFFVTLIFIVVVYFLKYDLYYGFYFTIYVFVLSSFQNISNIFCNTEPYKRDHRMVWPFKFTHLRHAGEERRTKSQYVYLIAGEERGSVLVDLLYFWLRSVRCFSRSSLFEFFKAGQNSLQNQQIEPLYAFV